MCNSPVYQSCASVRPIGNQKNEIARAPNIVQRTGKGKSRISRTDAQESALSVEYCAVCPCGSTHERIYAELCIRSLCTLAAFMSSSYFIVRGKQANKNCGPGYSLLCY